MKEKEEKVKYYVAYNAKCNDVAIYENLYKYRIGREQYCRNHKGRVTKVIARSRQEAIDVATDIIRSSFYPKLPLNMMKYVSMNENEFMNIGRLTSSIPPYYIHPSFVEHNILCINN